MRVLDTGGGRWLSVALAVFAVVGSSLLLFGRKKRVESGLFFGHWSGQGDNGEARNTRAPEQDIDVTPVIIRRQEEEHHSHDHDRHHGDKEASARRSLTDAPGSVTSCETPSKTNEEAAAAKKLMEQLAEMKPLPSLRTTTTGTRQVRYTIPVFFHIVESVALNGIVNANPAIRDVATLVTTLNHGFRNSPFAFTLLGSQVIVDDSIFFMCPNNVQSSSSSFTTTVTDQYALLPRDHLEVFLCNYGGAGKWVRNRNRDAGVAFIGHWYELDNGVYTEVGVGVTRPTIGLTLIHEVGHHLNLDHTFEGGCDAVNDGVADTPAMAQSTLDLAIISGFNSPFSTAFFQCFRPAGTFDRPDTCPLLPGVDPSDNYMDYGATNCVDEYGEFSPGQWDRMQAHFEATIYIPTLNPAFTTGWAWRVRTTFDGSTKSSNGDARWGVLEIQMFADADCTVPVSTSGGTPVFSEYSGGSWPSSWGVPGNAFDGNPSTDFFWFTFSSSDDMWVGIEYAPSAAVTVLCMIITQDSQYASSELTIEVKPAGAFFWNPVIQANTGVAGANILQNRQTVPVVTNPPTPLPVPATSPPSATPLVVTAPPSTTPLVFTAPPTPARVVSTIPPAPTPQTDPPTAGPQPAGGTGTLPPTVSPVQPSGGASPTTPLPSIAPVASGPTSSCLAETATCSRSKDCCSMACAGKFGVDRTCAQCAPQNFNCFNPTHCCDSAHICTGRNGKNKLCKPCAPINFSCQSSAECCKGVCAGPTLKMRVCRKCAQRAHLCTTTADCCSPDTKLQCLNGKCLTCKGTNKACKTDTNCCGALICGIPIGKMTMTKKCGDTATVARRSSTMRRKGR